MEFRIRKFLPSRRAKASPDELSLHSVLYQAAPISPRQPVFIHQPLGRSRIENENVDEALALRSFSYTSATPGKPPIIGGRPQKGNGPVKLQTGRRLSSGEILVTTEDHQRTLEEIRDGEYLVAGRESRDSRVPDARTSSLVSKTASSIYSAPPTSYSRTKTQFGSPQWPSSPLSPSYLSSTTPLVANTTSSPEKRPIRTANSQSDLRARSSSGQNTFALDGLGILNRPCSSSDARSKYSTLSLRESHDEQNATIHALWKAEYGRLVTMYGQDGVDRNIADLNRDHGKLVGSDSSATQLEHTTPMFFEPLPKPSLELRNGSLTNRSSSTSHGEQSHHDDGSDESQKCLSIFSTTGRSSSHTTGTSVGDADSITTREDIRKIVADMRSTYLRAIESQGPVIQTKKSTKKKRRRKSSIASGPPTEPVPAIPSTPEKLEALRPHSSSSSPGLNSRRSQRTSQPVAGITKLTSIQASPSKPEREPEIGLKRADSTTLGSMMGETTTSTKQKRKSKVAQPDPFVQQSNAPLIRNEFRHDQKPNAISDAGKSIHKNQSYTDDIELFCKDIFGAGANSFWQTSTIEPATIAAPSGVATLRVQKSPTTVTTRKGFPFST